MSIDVFEREQEFENVLRKSPGAKLFFNLSSRRLVAESPLVAPQPASRSKSVRNGPLLSPLAKILKQRNQDSAAGNGVKGNVALNGGFTSPTMPPPRTTFVYRRKGDTPDEFRVKLKGLHHSTLQLPDTPDTFNGDVLCSEKEGEEGEELEEDEEEDEDGDKDEDEEDDNNAQEDITEKEQLYSDDVCEPESSNQKTEGRMKSETPTKFVKGDECKILEDRDLETSFEEQKSKRTSVVNSRGKTFKDTPANANVHLIREEKSERTTAFNQKEKTYRDTPPNIDMNDVIEETVMDQWYLTQPRKRIIVIEGHRVGDPEDQLWHSSAISKRLSPRVLVTASGSRYRIKGPVNKEMTLENGFPAEVVKKFLKGFPADWKEIIQELCLRSEGLVSQKAVPLPDTTSKGRKKQSVIQETKGASKRVKQGMVGKTTPVTTGKKKANKKTKQGELKGQSERKSTPSNARTQTSSAAFKTPTPRSSETTKFVALHELQCSRSGRRILPPLAYWTGERIRPNYRFDKVELIAGSKDDISNLTNTPKLIGLLSDDGNARTLRPRQKETTMKSGSSKSQLHKTKGGSVAKQPKKKSKSAKSRRGGQIVAKDKGTKHKATDETKKSQTSVRSDKKGEAYDCESESTVEDKEEETKQNEIERRNKKGKGEGQNDSSNRHVMDKAEKTAVSEAKDRNGSGDRRRGRSKGQIEVQNNENEKERKDGRGKNIDERETIYRSRKYKRGQPRKCIDTDIIGNQQDHDDLDNVSDEIMTRRVTRSQSSAKNAKKRVGENVSVEHNLLQKEDVDRIRKGDKNSVKHQRAVNQRQKGSGLSRPDIVANSEESHTSDTESAKQEKERQRMTKQGRSKQWNGNTSFDLFGDILGILAKQKQKRNEIHTQNMKQSSRHQKTGSEGESSDMYDVQDKEEDKTRATDNQGKETKKSWDRGKENQALECKAKVSGGTWMIKKKRKNSEKETALVGSFQKSPEAWSSQDRVQPLVEEVEQSAEYDGDVESVSSSNQRKLEKIQHPDLLLKGNGTTKKRDVSQTKDDEEDKKVRTTKGSRRNKKTKLNAEKENKDEDAWTVDEMERLQRAMKTIKPSTTNFWEKVAETVGTRDEEECRIQHQSSVDREEAKPGRERKPAKATTKATITINAKKGTLKRKRQLRELAEHHNMGYEEDLFDATPYRIQKKNRIHLCDSSDEEEDEAPAPSKTPSLTMPSVLPFSTKKTPHANWTPGLLQSVNRNKAEEYIYRMQKRKNLAKSTPLATRPLAKIGKSKNKFQSRIKEKEVQEAFDVKEVTEDEDSDVEKDYYWSEEEDDIAT